MKRIIIGLAAVAAAALVPSVAQGADAGAARLAGQAERSPVFVGVVSDGRSLVAYVCDGRRVSQWFRGAVVNGRASIRNPAGARLTIRFAKGGATGAVSLGSRGTVRFRLTPARGRAGLFRRADRRFRAGAPESRLTGWIRLNDGRVRGLAERTVAGRTLVLAAPEDLPPASARLAVSALLPACTLPAPRLIRPLAIRPPSAPLCQLDLPAPAPPRSTTDVLAAAPQAGIGEQAAVQLEANGLASIEEGLRQVGILPSLPPQLDSAFLAYEAALRSNASVKAAGARLGDALRARDAAAAGDRLAELRAALTRASIRNPSTTGVRLRRGRSFPSAVVAGNRSLQPLPARVVLRSPNFASVRRVSKADGSFASGGASLGDRVDLFARASGQDATSHIIAATVFDVPANVAEVEIKTVGWSIYGSADYSCQLGWAHGFWAVDAWASKQQTPGGGRPPAVSEVGFQESNGQPCLIPEPPIPDPAPLDAEDPEITLRFRPDAAGGRYQLNFQAYAGAGAGGLAYAWADASASFDRVEVTFER